MTVFSKLLIMFWITARKKNVLPISKIDVHFYFYAAGKTFNRKINQMVMGKEVGSLLRPFSYCQVSCQKLFPCKQINTSLAIAGFALRWIFCFVLWAMSLEKCQKWNRKTWWIHYQSGIDRDLLLTQILTQISGLCLRHWWRYKRVAAVREVLS